ncbi:hypothetical protein fugu_009848 [Takifugu bimaculatus]|uniref:Uncharacterized protein n=1 Tax=Takifugu bimaculatus TaxID=433685 RepID=A0A4Z2CDY0_9TELE|nr:hypothetical protein fugu_009848 [Takifugu bimaculatus]
MQFLGFLGCANGDISRISYYAEYDAQLAPGRSPESDMASSSYLEPNHNHSAASGLWG